MSSSQDDECEEFAYSVARPSLWRNQLEALTADQKVRLWFDLTRAKAK
jgi:hypothetical protein